MKNGLLYYRISPIINTYNVGDYIQSLAAAQFFSNIDVIVHRERLDEYDDEEIKLIMNGWFMKEPNHWPPSNKIHPLFISFHINSSASNEMLTEKGIAYLKNHEPIGCRDIWTTNLLKEKGINAYFSGCLTLTLGNKYISVNPDRNKIYICDLVFQFHKNFLSILKYFGVLAFNFNTIYRLYRKLHNEVKDFSFIRTIAFFTDYRNLIERKLLLSAEYTTHQVNGFEVSEEDKFNYAKDMLNKYANAKFVITSRIHCALPCLALNTPVLYVNDVNAIKIKTCRLDGIMDLFNFVHYNKGNFTSRVVKNKINQDMTFSNPKSYISMANKLKDVCQKFSL